MKLRELKDKYDKLVGFGICNLTPEQIADFKKIRKEIRQKLLCKEYRKTHKVKRNAYDKKWRKEHPDKVIENRKKWYANNKDNPAYIEKRKQWYAKNGKEQWTKTANKKLEKIPDEVMREEIYCKHCRAIEEKEYLEKYIQLAEEEKED